MRWLSALLLCFCMTAAGLEPNLLTNGSLEGDADGDGVADGWVAEVHRQEGGEDIFAVLNNSQAVIRRDTQKAK